MIWPRNLGIFETVIDTSMKNSKTARKFITFPFATLIVTYQPPSGVPITKENGAWSAGQAEPIPRSANNWTLLLAISTCGDKWKTKCTNLRYHSPFESFEKEFHRT
jgi:hypothetical protein